MLNMASVKLGPIPKLWLILAPWGIGIILGGFIQQNMDNPTPSRFLMVWAVVTVVGLLGQALGLCKGLEWNFIVWVIAISLAWAFTYFVFMVYMPMSANDPILLLDIAPVWLALMGVAFVFTAIQVSSWFWLLAIAHFVMAVLMELSSRNLVRLDYLDANQALLVGLVDGGLMVVALLASFLPPFRESTPVSTAQV